MSADRNPVSQDPTGREPRRADLAQNASSPSPIFALSSVPPPSPARTLWWGAAFGVLAVIAIAPWSSEPDPQAQRPAARAELVEKPGVSAPMAAQPRGDRYDVAVT